MKDLFDDLKPFYKQFLQRGVSYGLSSQEIHEAALNLLIRIFGLFFLRKWVFKFENGLFDNQTVRNGRSFLLKLLFQPQFREEIDLPFIIRNLLSSSHYEKQLKDALSQEEWDDLISILYSYRWTLEENFQQKITSKRIITPEFLSFFYEQILFEYDKFLSLKSSISPNRKKKGIYFTPWFVIREITDECLDRYRNDQRSRDIGVTRSDDGKITILDPSCGTGSFLAYAAESLYRRLKDKKNMVLATWILQNCIFGVELSPSSLLVAKFRLICWALSKNEISLNDLPSNILMNLKNGNSLFGTCKESLRYPLDYGNTIFSLSRELGSIGVLGFDDSENDHIDWIRISSALEKARWSDNHRTNETVAKVEADLLSLIQVMYWEFLKRKSPKVRIEDLTDLKLFHWEHEFPHIMLDKGFDICIGNPPYGRSILSSFQKQLCKLLFQSCIGPSKKYSLNAAAAFIERAISLLKPRGLLGFIVPFSILRVEEFEALRGFLLETTQVWKIRDEAQAFEDVTLEMCSLFLRNTTEANSKVQIYPRDHIKANSKIPIEPFRKYARFMIYHDELWQKTVRRGETNIVSGDYGIDHRVFKKDHVITPSRDNYTISYLHSGRCVAPFGLKPQYFQYIKAHPHNQRFLTYFNEPRLISTAIGNKLRVAYKPEKFIPGTNVSVLEVPRSYQFLPMLILLNSDLLNYVLKRYILNFSRLTVYLHKYYTKLLPIVYPKKWEIEFTSLATWLIFLSQETIFERKKVKGLRFLRSLANLLVYELYFPESVEVHELTLDYVGKYLKPLDIHTYLDLVLSGRPLHDSERETLDHLIQQNSSAVYRGINLLRHDEVIREAKRNLQQTSIVKRIRIEL
ncbi:MAG: Eco57I restriction-modification methylase domain-containing protein [Candidatus Heimdallarchaeota archaeon]